MGDDLIRYLQSVFVKKAGDPQYNPYADYSKSIVKEADEIMTIVGMFEKRGELRGEERGEKRGERIGQKRGEDRLRNLFFCLRQQGREEDIDEIMSSFSTTRLHYVASDGLALFMREAISNMDNDTFNLFLKYHFAYMDIFLENSL